EIITGVGEVLPGKQFLHWHRVMGEATDPRLIQVEDVVRARSPRCVRAHLRQNTVERQQLPYDVDAGERNELMLHDLARCQGGRRILGHDVHRLPGQGPACVTKKSVLITGWLDRGARAGRGSDLLDCRRPRRRPSRARKSGESRKPDTGARADLKKSRASYLNVPELVGRLCNRNAAAALRRLRVAYLVRRCACREGIVAGLGAPASSVDAGIGGRSAPRTAWRTGSS